MTKEKDEEAGPPHGPQPNPKANIRGTRSGLPLTVDDVKSDLPAERVAEIQKQVDDYVEALDRAAVGGASNAECNALFERMSTGLSRMDARAFSVLVNARLLARLSEK